MKRVLVFVFLFALIDASSTVAQTKRYIARDTFTKVVSVYSKVYPSDDIVNVGVHYEMGEDVPWGSAESIISYRYLGIDNGHNLHIMRSDGDDVCNLIFSLDTNDSGIITLAAERSQKTPLPIVIEVRRSGGVLGVRYLGELPEYKGR